MASKDYSSQSPFGHEPSVTSPLIHQSSPRPEHLSIALNDRRQSSLLPSPTDSLFSNTETVVELEDENEDEYYSEKNRLARFGSISAGHDEADRVKQRFGYKSWKDPHAATRRKVAVVLCAFVVVLGVGVVSFAAGRSSQPLPVAEKANLTCGGPVEATDTCDPYAQHGVLLVNTEVAAENRWSPIAAPASCQPVDYTSLILASRSETPSREIDFVRNRTIVLFGDSVDRYHNHHLCDFVQGRLEMIGSDHPMSPPYPEGRELPPEDYRDKATGERVWPNFDQSRPFICHVDHLGLRILNVFHYGYRDDDDWIATSQHFYPPGKIEDRFDNILVPLVASISKKYHTAPTPDLISMTSGYWGLFRLSVEQDEMRDQAIVEGETESEALFRYDTFRNMNKDRRDWLEMRMISVLRYIATGWEREQLLDEDEDVQSKPQILWRTLHHLNKEIHHIPFDRIQSLDSIGRSVVERLINEGRAAVAGGDKWSSWTEKSKAFIGVKEEEDKDRKQEASQMGLGERLKVNEWGRLVLGQENHFIDDVHPKPLPSSFLYSNILFENLKEAVTRWERK